MHRQTSQYTDHPRVTWFGIGGTVAYVDYTTATKSFFVGSDGRGGFKVVPPVEDEAEDVTGLASFDAGLEYALWAAGESPRDRLLRLARQTHDKVCSCDPRYLMSCPRMAVAVLEAGRKKRG